jgi:hypothetical protein
LNADSVKENKMSEEGGLPEGGGEAEGEAEGEVEGVEYQDQRDIDLSGQLTEDRLKVCLESARFPEMGYLCGQIARHPKTAESVKENYITFISTTSSPSVANSYYNTEDDRKLIVGGMSLNEQLLMHTGYKCDINRNTNYWRSVGRYGGEVQSRKGRNAQAARLLATTIVRQEQGVAPSEREMQSGKRGLFDWIWGK